MNILLTTKHIGENIKHHVHNHTHSHGTFDLLSITLSSLKIIAIVIVFMIIVELIELKFSGFLKKYLTNNKFLQYFITSLFGIIPGCAGTFAMSSMYMAGIIGFGGIVAVMVSTFGDEAFVIFATSPKTAFILIAITFPLGIIAGYIADFIQKKFNIKINRKCCITHHKGHDEHLTLSHFFKDHIWKHIIKKHIPSIFIWLFISIALITFLNEHVELHDTIFTNRWKILILASLVGTLPISGPNLFFLTLFLNGSLPFSILLTNSIIQDGHGLLPILGYSIEDAFKIKLFNLTFGLIIGSILLLLGL